MAVVALDWPAPPCVKAFYTTRQGGCSQAPYDSFNLGLHVNDLPAAVQSNRQQLGQALIAAGVPAALHIQYLNQVHGIDVFDLDGIDLDAIDLDGHGDIDQAVLQNQGVPSEGVSSESVPSADAAITSRVNRVCLVMTADCLPVFFTDRRGDQVAVAHAGWRGLVAGVLQHTVSRFRAEPAALMAYLGPAIGPAHFEVGPEVKQRFVNSSLGKPAESAFYPSEREQHYFADLYRLATLALHGAGVESIYGGNFCTYSDVEHFFSYRRDGETGRMASLILKTAV